MEPRDTSRRSVLKLVAGTALAALAALPRAPAAQAKVPKAAMKYQDRPQGGQRCSGCTHFIAGGECKIVEGRISPEGWCTAFSARR